MATPLAPTPDPTLGRGVILFGLVVLGVLGNWFWGIGWVYVQNPDRPLATGKWTVVLVRFVLSLIAATLTFIPVFDKIDEAARGSLIGFLIAFQTGFFWQAAFDAVVKTSKADLGAVAHTAN